MKSASETESRTMDTYQPTKLVFDSWIGGKVLRQKGQRNSALSTASTMTDWTGGYDSGAMTVKRWLHFGQRTGLLGGVRNTPS